MDPAPDPDDRTAYRRTLGAFATGVCVVTAHTSDGPYGITVNSFTSVSLNPRLILWCLDAASDRHALFEAAERFAVHVLPVEDREMSDRFAWGVCQLSPDEFDMANPEPPRLRNALARLDCVTVQRVPMGDHLTIVGEVRSHESRPGDALTYFRGRYGSAMEPSA